MLHVNRGEIFPKKAVNVDVKKMCSLKYNLITLIQKKLLKLKYVMTHGKESCSLCVEKILPEILEGLPGMEELKRKIAAIRGKTGSQMTLTSVDWEIKRTTLTLEQRVEDMECRLASHSSKLRRQDALFCDKYDTVLNQIRELEAGLTHIKLVFNLEDGSSEVENLFSPENIKMLMEKNEIVSKDVESMYEEISQLKTEVEKNQHDFAGVIEELEGIHTTKVDRFEIDDILADKADCSEVQCKVSTDIFEEFCNSLTKGVDYAIKNTVEQEKQWRKELEKMLEEMERKFNKEDVDPLKEELEKKIEDLSTRLDQVARMKTYTMAAGSKRRLYTDVNCVACDKKAAMEMEEERRSTDKEAGLKPFLNAKPYISVELEQLKKMRIKSPGAKNLQLHEQIMKNYALSVGFDLLPEHEVTFVNRYCGGADTLINPRQRVAKIPRNAGKCPNSTSSR